MEKPIKSRSRFFGDLVGSRSPFMELYAMMGFIPQAHELALFDVDSVSRDFGEMDFSLLEDLPCVPPFSGVVFEYILARVCTAIMVVTSEVDEEDRGWMLTKDPLVDLWEENLRRVGMLMNRAEGETRRRQLMARAIDRGDVVRWVVASAMVARPVTGPIEQAQLVSLGGAYLDEDGRVIPETVLSLPRHLGGQSMIDGLAEFSQLGLMVGLFCSAMTHCRNVEVIDKPESRAVMKKRLKRGESGFKILKVKPFGGKRYTGQPAGGHRQSPRAHVRRGHFKTYTEDRPLFGKVTGTFYIPPTYVNPDQEHRVDKHYKLEE